MRNGRWVAVAALSLTTTLAACDRGTAAGRAPAQRGATQARADSARDEQKALRDSGVSVDTQTIDTGSAATATPAEDN